MSECIKYWTDTLYSIWFNSISLHVRILNVVKKIRFYNEFSHMLSTNCYLVTHFMENIFIDRTFRIENFNYLWKLFSLSIKGSNGAIRKSGKMMTFIHNLKIIWLFFFHNLLNPLTQIPHNFFIKILPI